ncbi:hypothetical protein M2168_002223 [Streptomyces sp. CZ24]|nr:hypothetical protein [Streptomyces sp. CZ24]MDH6189191.1 hypothetical protein [Streptomyces sp. CZ24]
MTTARTVTITAYALGYMIAIYTGATALETGDGLYAAGLFTTSVGLLLGIHREARHAASLVRVVAAYRHGGMLPGPAASLAEIERATATPPGCHRETWWPNLGGRHAPTCPAVPARKDTR